MLIDRSERQRHLEHQRVGVIAVTVTNKAGCSAPLRKEVIGCDYHLPCCKDFLCEDGSEEPDRCG
jgi:hypothetical protein